jgi:hypothetical protein
MRLKSAREDFETNTLGAVPGLLGRLSYLGGLQDGKGMYEHWGLAKVYGADAAQGAISAAHRVLISEILKKPLGGLLKDVVSSCGNEDPNEDPKERKFLASLTQAQPRPLSPAALAHLRSVMNALSALIETRDGANPRGASQPR